MSQSPEFFGKFILLERLATGGMAEVYLAKSTGAENVAKFVAVKRILPHLSQNNEFIKMFKEEAKIAVNLSHRNIVSIFEFGEERKQFFLVMEYVQGQNLRQMLNRARERSVRMEPQHALYVISEVARGLDHAHKTFDRNTGRPLNIIHRDISPQNIMISYDGDVKIVDFGIAKAESKIETTQAGTLKGKFSYMSPEQAEGHELDQRSDVFSLGIVLWELLTNERLFANNDERMILRRVREGDVPPVRRINPNISTELERIAAKALARDKNLRYQNANELHRDLNSYLNRQFPDFSSQDLANLISSLFDRETLEIRRRLVEYAKIRMTPEGEVTNTATATATATATETATGGTEDHAIDPSVGSENPAPQGLKEISADISGEVKLDFRPPKVVTSRPTYLVDTLQAPSSARFPSGGSGETGSSSASISYAPESSSLAPFFIVGGLIALAVAGYIFGLPDFSKLSGINLSIPKISVDWDRLKCRFLPCPSQTPVPAPTAPPNQGPAAQIVGLQVITEPPLSSVYVDGEMIGLSPATHQSLPAGRMVQIRIEKDSYLPVVIMHQVQRTGDFPPVRLQKAPTGYLKIEDTVYTITELTVDGNPILQKLPIERLIVPANRDIVVTARAKILGETKKEFRKVYRVEPGRATQVFIEFK